MATVFFVDANGTRFGVEATVLPDGNIAFNNVINGAGNQAAVDATGNQAMSAGSKTALNLVATAIIKATPGRLRKLIIIAPGSTGVSFNLSDCATVGAAGAANLMFSLPYNATANVAGAIFNMEMPFLVGLCLTAVPSGGSPICAVVYD